MMSVISSCWLIFFCVVFNNLLEDKHLEFWVCLRKTFKEEAKDLKKQPSKKNRVQSSLFRFLHIFFYDVSDIFLHGDKNLESWMRLRETLKEEAGDLKKQPSKKNKVQTSLFIYLHIFSYDVCNIFLQAECLLCCLQ